jgi:signal transduction histidine kinase
VVLFEPGRGEPPWARALGRLSGGARVEIARAAADGFARARAAGVDVVVLGPGAGSAGAVLLEQLRAEGPPVVVVEAEPADARALDWFRRGAADCVALGADGGEALARAVLAQARRRRALAARPAGREVAELDELRQKVLQSEKLASLGQLAAGVAHEINNPMGFIHANLAQMAEYAADLRRAWQALEELRKAAAAAADPELAGAAERLDALCAEVDVEFVLADLLKAIRESQEGSERIRHIVADLRDFSHQDPGEPVAAQLNDCLDSTANLVWPTMKHLVVLERNYADLPPLRCYPMQLKQVFMNLIVNAYQAIEEKLAGSGETGRIELRTERSGDCVAVCVSDTGVGIPEAHRSRIFEPFFTTKRVGTGTGLGLATSYGIVRRHGGEIEVKSEPGRGSTFRVLLPFDVDGRA